ncbi:hypothetical protein P7K49_009143, partial [Saguinus oedipus]
NHLLMTSPPDYITFSQHQLFISPSHDIISPPHLLTMPSFLHDITFSPHYFLMTSPPHDITSS